MLHVANDRCEETVQQLTRAIGNEEEEEGRTDRQTDEPSTVFLLGAVWSELCCLVGSSATVKAWPGHTGAGGGQRGESKGAQHYTDASPTTMSHFRPLWFGLGGWPPASWSSLSSSSAGSLHFLFLFIHLTMYLSFYSYIYVSIFRLST